LSPPPPQALQLPGPAGLLQALVEDPCAAGAAAPAAFALVCHPHPLHGGTMDNKVVTTLARSFHELAVPTIRFNFRGVGDSEGAFDDAVGETQDALAVMAWGRERWPDAAVWLAGFSFGGRVALRAASSAAARGLARLVTVAPAITRDYAAPSQVVAPACPWLIVQGDADEVIAAPEVIAWAQQIVPRPELAVLPGVGHFFHGSLNALRDSVVRWVRGEDPASPAP
jgi:uncharacterized protein